MKRSITAWTFALVLVAGFSAAQAADCVPGFFSATGEDPCSPCPSGYFGTTSGATSCEPCSAGTFGSTSGATSCTNCGFGEYNPSVAATSCEDCDPGTFADSLGSTACEDCSAGTFASGSGSTACNNCGLGQFSGSGASACSSCPAGTFSNTTAASSCPDCSAGTFSSSLGATACTDCGVGSFSSDPASTSCESCAAHTYQDMAGEDSCLNCPAGTYQPGLGQSSCLDRNSRRCWKAKDLKNPAAFAPQKDVPVADEVASGDVDLRKAGFYCSPAGLGGAPVADPDPRQCCYKVSGAKLANPLALEVEGDIGGTLQLELGKPALVCEQCLGTPTDEPLQCWKAKDLKSPAFTRQAGLGVVDGLATGTVSTVKPDLFCSPASVDGSPVTDVLAQQCCYRIKGNKLGTPVTVNTHGSIGGPLELSLSKQSMVCEPCTSTVLP